MTGWRCCQGQVRGQVKGKGERQTLGCGERRGQRCQGFGSGEVMSSSPKGLRLLGGGAGWAAGDGEGLWCQECGLRLCVVVPGAGVTKCVTTAVVWASPRCVPVNGPRGGETEEGEEVRAAEGGEVRGRQSTCACGWPV